MSDSYVYFALKGDNFDPDMVTQSLGISPTKTHPGGDSIGKNGNKIKFSGWYLYTDKVDNLLIDKLVEDVVLKLYNKIDMINEVKRNFNLTSILEIILYIDIDENASTPALRHDSRTIEFLFKTNTEIDVDIYKK